MSRPDAIGRSPLVLGAMALVLAACTAATTPSPLPASPSAVPSAASPSLVPTAGPTGSPAATVGGPAACLPPGLAARITRWEGTAGSFVAHIEARNTGTAPCMLPAAVRAELVDAKGTVLIQPSVTASATAAATTAAPATPPIGSAAPAPGALRLGAGAAVTTQVRVGNYCGATPVTPLAIALVLPGGARLLTAPLSPTDDTVPACMGAPGSAGSIEWQPWSA